MTEQAALDLEVKQGSTFRLQLDWLSQETSESPLVATSLAGYTARMQIKARASSTTALLTLTSDVLAEDYDPLATITLEPGAVTGQMDLYIGASRTELLTRNAVYDLELHLVGDDEEVVPLVGGAILLTKEVTK